MTGADDKSNKSNKMKTRQAGRKKVVKSPVKTSTPNEGEDDYRYCPCNEYMDGELSVGCENCGEYWHLCCVGLRGLTMEMVALLENWQCQDCYRCPHSYVVKSPSVPSSSNCGTIKVMVRDELNAIQPVIKVTVENAVRNILTKSVCSKDDVENVVKSYAEVTQESQKKAIQQVSVAQSSKVVAENVVRKLDADKVEREKRKTNVVILKAPEPNKNSTAEQKRAKDNEFCTSVLKIPASDIEVCWRAGKLDESKPDYCRPLVIKLKDEALVKEWTKEGKGHRTESGHWINQDLCAADRRANFQAREERRKRMEKKKN
ncbi:hypothetical protein ACHWQZ_G017497 [Mnemiopsis leidyi]